MILSCAQEPNAADPTLHLLSSDLQLGLVAEVALATRSHVRRGHALIWSSSRHGDQTIRILYASANGT